MMRKIINKIYLFLIIAYLYILKVFNRNLQIAIVRDVLCYGIREAINRQGIDFSRNFSFIVLSVDNRCSFSLLEKTIVVSLPVDYLRKVYKIIHPKLSVVFHSCLTDVVGYDIFGEGNFLIILTSLDPVSDVDRQSLGLYNLLHLNESGCLKIVCHTEQSRSFLNRIGFYNIDVIPPFVDLGKFSHIRCAESKIETFGFASAPVQEKDYINKGCQYLFEEFDKTKYKLIVPWRSDVLYPTEKKYSNVMILSGVIDMCDFYENIDALVLPYLNNENHAFPLSLIESIASCRPVIVSNCCGATSWLIGVAGGVVFTPNPHELSQSMNTLLKKINKGDINVKKSSERLIDDMETWRVQYAEILGPLRTKKRIVDLQEWDKKLRENSSYLVVGRKNIEEYYQRLEVVDNYDEDRFSHAKQDNISKLEIEFISCCCKSLKSKNSLIDIAAGTGRFHPIYPDFDRVFMLDSSVKMQTLCRKMNWFDDKCHVINDNIFDFDFNMRFDAIICFRLLRHLLVDERMFVFSKLKSGLSGSGRLFFDLPLRDSEMLIRSKEGWHKYNVYDFFWDLDSIQRELLALGLIIDQKGIVTGADLGQRWADIAEYQLILSVRHCVPGELS